MWSAVMCLWISFKKKKTEFSRLAAFTHMRESLIFFHNFAGWENFTEIHEKVSSLGIESLVKNVILSWHGANLFFSFLLFRYFLVKWNFKGNNFYWKKVEKIIEICMILRVKIFKCIKNQEISSIVKNFEQLFEFSFLSHTKNEQLKCD